MSNVHGIHCAGRFTSTKLPHEASLEALKARAAKSLRGVEGGGMEDMMGMTAILGLVGAVLSKAAQNGDRLLTDDEIAAVATELGKQSPGVKALVAGMLPQMVGQVNAKPEATANMKANVARLVEALTAAAA